MSGRAGGSPQNEAVPLDNNVTNVLQTAAGVGHPGSSLSTLGVDSHLVRQLMTPVKNSCEGTGELVRLSGGDPRSLHSYTPHSSPSTPIMGEITPSVTPCSSPRRGAPPLLLEPPAKRVKVEEKPSDRLELRRVILDWKKAKLSNVKETYNNTLVEMFFLENHGNLMDLSTWCRRPSKEFLQHISVHKLEGDTSLEARFSHPTAVSSNAVQQTQIKSEVGVLPMSPSKSSSALIKGSSSPLKPSKGMVTPVMGATGGRQKTPSISESTSTTPNSQQDQMMEKARQEAYVVQRIGALRKEGLWGEKRLPKVQEPPRTKVHWDYLLEEMVWLSADFASERKWKKAAARKCARMVQKYFNDKALAEQRAQKEQDLRIRKVAAFVAKEIRTFWGNVEKLVEYKVTTKLDEKKKRALDQQLSFIVDQTEKYSSMLAESMSKPNDSTNASIASGTPSRDGHASDEEFRPDESSDDDEATIAREEDNPEEQADELKLLQKESEQTLEDILNDLPPGYLDSMGQGDEGTKKVDCDTDSDKSTPNESSEQKIQSASDLSANRKSKQTIGASNLDDIDSNMDNDNEVESVSERRLSSRERRRKVRLKSSDVTVEDKEAGDEDFKGDENDEDEEDTIQEQEEKEGNVDYKRELEELEADNDVPIEELRRRIAEMAEKSEPMEEDDSAEESEDNERSDDEEDEDEDETAELEASKIKTEQEDLEEDETMSVDEDEEEDDEGGDDDDDDDEDDETASDEGEEDCFGLETLVRENLQTESSPKKSSETANRELEDAATVAEALQPKGFTLSSTKVSTPVPFLLKHTLREYQHVGLDWLYTMFEKKLNGILADEMGLGKTIQTISVLAHLACEKGNWGPHLIVVPTSVMLNWEMEFKKWCPAFKILTYYGTQKERKMKRTGWTKPNAFHVCITSYKLVIQDHQSFRRKKWKYFILDEAQNIKNFKSQRWQLLLNFQSQRRLLLTGTPLQNNLMELWSLMHFLMPNVFASHREFKEWFSNPVTGMIEGNKEYNESIIKRLHKVLRPFILRRLKSEVEQQMPKKYEHVVMCRLSKRQRFLYEEFMSRSKTRETLESGNFLSVINVLMQLRKVCNHPNLFESRPTISPFMMDSITYTAPSLVWAVKEYDPFKHIDLFSLNLLLADLEVCLTAFAAHRIRKFQAPKRLIEEIDSAPEIPPKCPAGKIKLHVRPSNPAVPRVTTSSSGPRAATALSGQRGVAAVGATTPSGVATAGGATPTMSALSTGAIRFHLVQQGGALRAIPVASGGGNMVIQQTAAGPRLIMPGQRAAVAGQGVLGSGVASSPGTNTGTSNTGSPQLGGLQLVQTSTGQLLLTSAPVKPQTNTTTQLGVSGTAATALLQRLQGLRALQGSMITTGPGGRPVLRLPTTALRPTHPQQPQQPHQFGPQPVAASTPTVIRSASPASSPLNTPIASPVRPVPSSPSSRLPTPNTTPTKVTTRTEQREAEKLEEKKKEDERKRSLFFMNDLDERRRKRRKEKLDLVARLNTRRCHACPIYGSDLIEAVNVVGSLNGLSNRHGSWKGQGLIQCLFAISENPRQYYEQTVALHSLVKTPEGQLEDLRVLIDRFVFCVPSVVAPSIEMRIFHPPPSKLWEEQRRELVIKQLLVRPMAPLHHIINSKVTQFPDPRLIQYDCGKLQILDKLLRQLKTGNHRVLIFTQMTRMLDVFESFLNYHGQIYLRLDGTTKVEQRQVLMERFNQDKRIFAMILSTRSGGVGVNLTGADTVIFYDSDWNPTMDAQAQDRCHRIGQTRDVHIYRLISEKTIEENILKKANQKRLLGDLAIEGGNFTTAHFKKQTINDLFDVNEKEDDASKRMSEVLEKPNDSVDGEEKQRVKMGAALESALAAAEDESDVQAAKTAKAEAAADLAEFDETIPIDEADTAGAEMSKAEQEVALLMKQLTPVEKYAMTFLESADDGWAAEAERMSAEIEQQKKEWELGRLQALREEEERLQQNSDEEQLTYSSVDAHNQVNNKVKKRSTSTTTRNIRSKRKVSTKKSVTRSKKLKGERCSQVNEEETSNENSVDNSIEDSNLTTSKDGSGDEVEEVDGVVQIEDEETETSSESDVDYSSDEALERALEKRLGNSPEKINLSSMSEESPRTRSRGNVKINLWTLDVNPVLPGEKPVPISRKQIEHLREKGLDIPTDGETEENEGGGGSRSGSALSGIIGNAEASKNSEQDVSLGAIKQGIVEDSRIGNFIEDSLVAVNGDVEVEGRAGKEKEVVIGESVERMETEGCGSIEVSNYMKSNLPTLLNNGSNGPTRITIENGTQ